MIKDNIFHPTTSRGGRCLAFHSTVPETTVQFNCVSRSRRQYSDRMGTIKAPAGSEDMPASNSEMIRGSSSQNFLESGRNFRALIEHATDGIALINAQGRMIFASPSARRLFGYPPDFPMESLDNDACTHPDDLPAVLAMLHDLMPAPGMVRTLEYRFRHHGGGWRWIESCFSNLFDVPGVEAVVINFKIIDERKRSEAALAEANRKLTVLLHRAEDLTVKAEEATRAKSEFLSVVSHELRTPLNAVLGFAEILSETPLDKDQKSFANTILDRGGHLLELVDDILEFSSIENGDTGFETGRIVIADLVESACLTARKSTTQRGLEFRIEIAPGVPEQINGDARRICKILVNLLGNAVKFTAKGEVVLHVTPSTDSGGQALDFSVEDTGLGIPPGAIEKLFKPFMQADSTLSRPFGGIGLGLAMSKRLAEAMGGTLTLLSEPGQGSTFTFRMPLEDNPSSPS